VDCHGLLHLHASKAARACDAADACDGLVILGSPTLHVAAVAYGVGPGTIARARRLPPQERDRVREGKRPIVLPHTPAPIPVTLPATPVTPPVAATALDRLADIVAELGGVTETLNALAMMDCRVAA
jgi:hypothetical protein